MIGQKGTVIIDKPLGSYHPKHSQLYYPSNYGYIQGIMADDSEEQDAYVLGVDQPLKQFTDYVIAIIHRKNDNEDKWVVSHKKFSKEDIYQHVLFQEQYFEFEIIM